MAMAPESASGLNGSFRVAALIRRKAQSEIDCVSPIRLQRRSQSGRVTRTYGIL